MCKIAHENVIKKLLSETVEVAEKQELLRDRDGGKGVGGNTKEGKT